MSIPTDVREEEQVKALVAKVVADYGRIDIVDNNATDLGQTAFVVETVPARAFAPATPGFVGRNGCRRSTGCSVNAGKHSRNG